MVTIGKQGDTASIPIRTFCGENKQKLCLNIRESPASNNNIYVRVSLGPKCSQCFYIKGVIDETYGTFPNGLALSGA